MKKGSKMTIEQRERVSKGHLGQKCWNKGLKMSKAYRDKMSELTKRGICGMKGKRHKKVTIEKMRKSNKTKLLWQNPEYRKMMVKARKKMTGIKNPAYIDGRTPLFERVRHSDKMTKWSQDVFKRDDYTCKICGKRGYRIEAHHIKPFHKIMEDNQIKKFEQAMRCKELWELANGLTLCKDCHKKISTRR